MKQPVTVQLDAAAARLRNRTGPPIARIPQLQWPAGCRWCSGCQSWVPLFYVRGSRCVACSSRAGHSGMIEKTYGLTGAEYDRLLLLQGGRCAICRQRPGKKRLAVDHDHVTGRVRGLACVRCNHDLLGAAHDDVDILKAAVFYLENPPTSGRWVASPGPAERRLAARANATAAGDPPF